MVGPEGRAMGQQKTDLFNDNDPNLGLGVDHRAMPQYVIEREISGAGSSTEAQIREVSLRSLAALKSMGPQIQWLHSYVTEENVYCV